VRGEDPLESAENTSSTDSILVLSEDEEFAEKGFGKEKIGKRFGLVVGVLWDVDSWSEKGLSDGRKLSRP
jgi:hypothetical protein